MNDSSPAFDTPPGTSERSTSPVLVRVEAGPHRGTNVRLGVGAHEVFGRKPCGGLMLPFEVVSRVHGTIYVGPHFVAVTCRSAESLWLYRDRSDDPTLVREGRTEIVDVPTATINLRLRSHDPVAPEHDPLFGESALRLELDRHWLEAGAASVTRVFDGDDSDQDTLSVDSGLRGRTEYDVLVALCRGMFEPSSHLIDPPEVSQLKVILEETTGRQLSVGTIKNYLSQFRHLLGLSEDTARLRTLALMGLAVQTGLVTEEDVKARLGGQPLNSQPRHPD